MWTTGPQKLIILIWLADMHYITGNGVSLESAESVPIFRLGNLRVFFIIIVGLNRSHLYCYFNIISIVSRNIIWEWNSVLYMSWHGVGTKFPMARIDHPIAAQKIRNH